MGKGYFCIERSFLDEPLFHNEPVSRGQAWVELIGLAKFKDDTFLVNGQLVKGKRGCVYISQPNLATRWNWSKNKVIRFLRTLQTLGKVELRSSHLINCISICNYDEMQKAGTTVETTDGAAVGTTGGTAVETTVETRLIKEKKDKQVKQERITLSEDNVPISKKPASVKKIRVEQKAPTLVTKCRRVFEEFFMNNYGTAYYWTAKDGAAMKRLIGKLKYSRESYPKPMPTDDDSMVDALKKFLDYIQPGWILDNLDVPTLDGQYNKIIAAKNNKNKTLEQSMQVGVRMGLTDGRDLPDDMTDYLNPKNYI